MADRARFRLYYLPIAVAVLLLIVTIPFASAWAVYGWLSRSNAVAENLDQPTAAPIKTPIEHQAAEPVVPVETPVAIVQTPAKSVEQSTPPKRLAVQQPPKPEGKEPPPKVFPPFNRRDRLSEEDLRQQLRHVPVVVLDNVPNTSAQLEKWSRSAVASGHQVTGPVVLLGQRPDLQGLPLRTGSDCRLNPEAAANLDRLSHQLRELLDASNVKELRAALLNDPKKEWHRAEAVPCLMQMMQVENAEIRKVFVEVLGKIPDKRASVALAKRALSDLNPEVREAAARQLLDRPREDYRPLLLVGLRYPWGPVATHAAETLAYVKDTDAVPQLEKMLDQPDATLPFLVRNGTKETLMVREVVRISHLKNCLLCHAPSFAATDPVRGRVPAPDDAMPATQPTTLPTSGGFCLGGGGFGLRGNFGGGEYDDSKAIFVRADTTFLRQDFSVVQPVSPPAKGPQRQRFDYLVRTRPATLQEIQLLAEWTRKHNLTPSREAMLFALREITGKEYQSDGSVQAATP